MSEEKAKADVEIMRWSYTNAISLMKANYQDPRACFNDLVHELLIDLEHGMDPFGEEIRQARDDFKRSMITAPAPLLMISDTLGLSRREVKTFWRGWNARAVARPILAAPVVPAAPAVAAPGLAAPAVAIPAVAAPAVAAPVAAVPVVAAPPAVAVAAPVAAAPVVAAPAAALRRRGLRAGPPEYFQCVWILDLWAP